MHVRTLLLSLGLTNFVMISDHFESLYLGLAIVVLFSTSISTSTSTYSSIFSIYMLKGSTVIGLPFVQPFPYWIKLFQFNSIQFNWGS